jgi:hypothetical protein
MSNSCALHIRGIVPNLTLRSVVHSTTLAFFSRAKFVTDQREKFRVPQASHSGFSQDLNRGILVCPSLMVHCIRLAVSEKTVEVMHGR